MKINQKSGTVITLEEAINYTHTFQESKPEAIKSFYVGINKISQILEQDNCIGVRIYNGVDKLTGKNNIVLIGVDENGEDITQGVILEKLVVCPPYCPKESILIK